MGRRGFGLLATLALATLAGAVQPAPVGAQAPAEAITVQVSFGGMCDDPLGLWWPIPGSGHATIRIPAAVEQGETFRVEVDDIGGPPALYSSSFGAWFEATGAAPAAVGSSGTPGTFSDPELTVTGEPGTDVEIKLFEVYVRWTLVPGSFQKLPLGQDCSDVEVPPYVNVPPDVPASIPIVGASD